MSRWSEPMVITRKAALVFCVLVAVAMVAAIGAGTYAGSRVQSATLDNCLRIHGVVSALDDLFDQAPGQLRQYEREGTISRAQLARALRENEKQRKRLARADCPSPP